MNIREIPVTTLDGRSTTLAEFGDGALLVVNVASKCGFTPQYTQLEALHEKYGEQGLTIVGFPCNQFAGQEPGNADKIQDFCSINYGVTFPLMEKVKVNGRHAHPLYNELHDVPDTGGKTGRVRWNFEKFVIGADGAITRFRSAVTPDDPAVIAAIEAGLPARTVDAEPAEAPPAS
ncbi:glutathione peroxidase [Microterricola viridarii]|uniref:Glutathione peroxidase n=1 Tax=Microterricola viridarii TaxID=412690 RepID=A0A0X8E1R3_9MICO|nr:glutathione peroxidase [Microterricola viridarii]AMB58771.1 glutathione peroxidase [Microterricola viridarii]